jgi:uncharacterized protein with HEPN domain
MKDPRLYLIHILESGEKITAYTADGEAEFMKSTLIQDAVIRNFEIIGEATKRLDQNIRDKYPSIEWQYVEDKLPPLVTAVKAILDEIGYPEKPQDDSEDEEE